MSEPSEFTRRNVLRASGLAVSTGALGSASAATTDDTDPYASARQIPCLDVTDHMDGIETVDASLVPTATTNVGPGSMLFISRPDTTAVSGCTANFVWRDGGGTLYLGAAGHCFLPSSADASQSAGGSYDLTGVQVQACLDCQFGGATALNGLRGTVVDLGEVVYARQSQDGTDVGNDFGLVEIPSDVEHLVSPSMPTWGGPTEPGFVDAGETVVVYGNGVAVAETFATKARAGAGISHDTATGRWTSGLAAAPGDSGAAVEGAVNGTNGPEGVEAAGVLTHLTATGTAGTNVAKATEMATQAGLDVEVVYA